MEEPTVNLRQLGAISKRFARQLLTIGHNRLELLTVEIQEEREQLLQAILLTFGVVALALLSGITLTAAIIVFFWSYSPVATLLSLAVIYGVAAAYLCRTLKSRLQDWQTFSATLDQLRKDRACLETLLS